MPNFEPVNKKNKKVYKKQTLAQSLFPCKGDSAGEIIRKIVFLAAIVVLIAATVCVIYFYFIRSENINREMEDVKNMRGESNGSVISIPMHITDGEGNTEQQHVEILQEYAELYERNNDMVGWIEMYPWIGYPVLQTEDNEFYLKHNFDKQPTANGTIFADYEVPITADSHPANTIIYGHNLITRNMFEPLSYFRTQGFDFMKENYRLNYDTIYKKNEYLIFAVFLTNTTESLGEVFDYQNHVTFNSKSEFDDYVAECLDRSFYYTGIDLEYGDELLTLSTCDFSMFSDMRLVVVARKVRDDESSILDPETFIDNRGNDDNGNVKRKMFDAYYKSYGNQWAGRQWDTSWIKDYDPNTAASAS